MAKRLAALACGVAIMLASCGGGGSPQGQGGPPPADVNVAQVVVQPIVDWDQFSGRIEAVDHIEIRPRVSGYLDAVHFEEGGMVAKALTTDA